MMSDDNTSRIVNRLDIMTQDITELKVAVSRIESLIAMYPISDHENRIRDLERGWWKVAGIAIAVGMIPMAVTLVYQLSRMSG